MDGIKYRKVEDMRDSGIVWLGIVPTGWKVKPLNTIFFENKAKNKRGLENNLLSLSYGKIVNKDIESNFGLLPASFNAYQIVKKGYLIFRLTDLQNDKRSLRVGLAKEQGIITSAYLGLINQTNNCIDYMYYLYHAYDLFKVYYNMGGGLRQSITFDDIKKLPTLLPPISDQKKIANFLDAKTAQFDSIIAKKELLIQKLEEAKKSLISEVVTGKVKIVDGEMLPRQPEEMKESGIDWLGMIPMEWEIKKIKHISVVVSKGTTPSTIGRDILDNGETRFLKAENIINNKISEYPEFFIDKQTNRILKRSELNNNDILFVIAGATIGKTAVVPDYITPANTNQAISFIRLKKDENYNFIFYWLISYKLQEYMRLKAVQSAQPNLSMENLSNLYLPYPSDSEKEKIVEYLVVADRKINYILSTTKQQIEMLKQAKQSLISEAVTGKIDLRDWEIIEEGELQ